MGENNTSKLMESRWADIWENWELVSKSWSFPVQMSKSDGTAIPLVYLQESKFWADLIRFAPWEWVALHTHPGDHILLVTKWEWILTYWKNKHPMTPWMIYVVPGNIPHAIDASKDEEIVLMALWNNLIPAEDPDRLDLV